MLLLTKELPCKRNQRMGAQANLRWHYTLLVGDHGCLTHDLTRQEEHEA